MKDLSQNPYLNGWKLEDVNFESRAAMVKAMQDPLYGKDADYTDLVAYLCNQPFTEDGPRQSQQAGIPQGRRLEIAMADRDSARKIEDRQVLNEMTVKMFGDPRYEKSALYRREVQEFLRANDPELSAMAGNSLIDRNRTKGVWKVELGKTEDAAAAIRADQKAAAIEAEKAHVAEQHKLLDEGLSTDLLDLGGQRIK